LLTNRNRYLFESNFINIEILRSYWTRIETKNIGTISSKLEATKEQLSSLKFTKHPFKYVFFYIKYYRYNNEYMYHKIRDTFIFKEKLHEEYFKFDGIKNISKLIFMNFFLYRLY
jgi:hypothetical protein